MKYCHLGTVTAFAMGPSTDAGQFLVIGNSVGHIYIISQAEHSKTLSTITALSSSVSEIVIATKYFKIFKKFQKFSQFVRYEGKLGADSSNCIIVTINYNSGSIRY